MNGRFAQANILIHFRSFIPKSQNNCWNQRDAAVWFERTSLRFTATPKGEFVIPSQKLRKRLVEMHGRATEQGAIAISEALGDQLTRFKAVCWVKES